MAKRYTLAQLEAMTASEALALAGYGHRHSEELVNQRKREIFDKKTGAVVAALRADEAHQFAFDALSKADKGEV